MKCSEGALRWAWRAFEIRPEPHCHSTEALPRHVSVEMAMAERCRAARNPPQLILAGDASIRAGADGNRRCRGDRVVT